MLKKYCELLELGLRFDLAFRARHRYKTPSPKFYPTQPNKAVTERSHQIYLDDSYASDEQGQDPMANTVHPILRSVEDSTLLATTGVSKTPAVVHDVGIRSTVET